MGAGTYIEWTDATWNPIGGCSIKSPGCIKCYAQKLSGTRLRTHPLYAGTTDIEKGKPVFNGKLTESAPDHAVWSWPVRWRGSNAPKLGPGMPSLIFVGDMSDLFHEDRPFATIDRVIAPLVYSRPIGQLLTKRPDVMERYLSRLRYDARWLMFPHPLFGKPNWEPLVASFECSVVPRLWAGCSVERQREANERWASMRRLHEMGFTTFVSYEPAIGPVDWTGWEFVDQIISGGESGEDDPRPSHPDWHRATRDFCKANGIAYFFKQWGAWNPVASTIHIGTPDRQCAMDPKGRRDGGLEARQRDGDDLSTMQLFERVGKKAAGRLLDGREWNEFPTMTRNRAPAAQPALL